MKNSRQITGRAGLVAMAVVVLALGPARLAPIARADSSVFTATFQETLTSFTCAGSICTVTATGLGHAARLGATTEDLTGTVDGSTHPCATLRDTRILTAATGDQLFVRGIGQECGVPPNKPQQMLGTLDWTITGGTGALAGATGSGTERLEPGSQPFVLAHYIGSLVP